MSTKPPVEALALGALLEARSSVRGFSPEPLSQDTLDELFRMAQQAPSWCNTQPWRLVLTSGEVTRRVSAALVLAAKEGLPSPDIDFPLVYPEPYNRHRRQCGGSLYGAMGVARDDKVGRYNAWLRNYEFFDAPHVVIVSRDKSLGEYATLDVGVWLGMFLLAAQSLRVDTCAMASVAGFPKTLRKYLEIPDNEVILCGIALGTKDPGVAANGVRTARGDVAANLRHITQASTGKC